MTIMHSVFPEEGKVTVDGATCTACGLCADICAGEVLRLVEGRVRVRDDSPFGCIACGHCMMICPTDSIRVKGRGVDPMDVQSLPPREMRATTEALEALMLGRRSVRKFTEEEVSEAQLRRIADMAASAPMGIPPWDIGCVLLCGRDEVARLASEVIKGYEGFLKLFRPWVLDLMRPFVKRETYEQFRHFVRPLAESYVRNHREGRDTLFYDAPALLLFHHSPYADPVDAAIACTYAMLAAESMGLGTTMIGGAPPIIQRDRKLSESLGIPRGNKASFALIVGHPAIAFRRAIRRHFTSVARPGSDREKHAMEPE